MYDATDIRVFCDGACDMQGRSGWAWVAVDALGNIVEEDYAALPGKQTNNRAELCAVGNALVRFETSRRIVVYCDANYVVECFNQMWYAKWRTNGWTSSGGNPVINRDLFEPLIALVEKIRVYCEIEFVKVKGHSGNRYNERADVLAVAARGGAPLL